MPISYIGATFSVYAGTPASVDAAGFLALASFYVPCGQVVAWPGTGDEFEDIPLSNMSGRIKHKTGDADGGVREFAFAYALGDAGQEVLRAANGANQDVSVRIVDNDGNAEYFFGVISNLVQNDRTTSNYKGQKGLISVNSPVIMIPGGGGAVLPFLITPPAVTGSPVVGNVLGITQGTWGGTAPISRVWSFLRGSTVIGPGPTYTVVTGDIGSTISVRETASNVAGTAAPSTSAPTAAVTAGGGGATTTGIIGNRFQIATMLYTSAVPAGYTSRRHHYAHADGNVTNIQCIDTHWYINNGPVAAPAARSIKKYIEYPAGVFHQVLWGGNATLSITAGSYKSDVVMSSVTGLPLVITAGAIYYERTVNLSAMATNTMPFIRLPAASNTLSALDGNSTTDLGNSGTIGQSTTEFSFGSAAMVGTIQVASARSFMCFGDSIVWGSGDVSSVGAKGGSGWVARMLDVHGYSYVKVAQAGQTTAMFLATATPLFTDFLAMTPFSEVIEEHGINDIRVNVTQSTLLANHQTIYGLVSGKVINQTTILPRSASTDGWVTEVNQTPKTDGNMAALNSINAAIRAVPANVTRILEAADAGMSARDSGIWKANSTLDGTHPVSSRAAAMATTLAATL